MVQSALPFFRQLQVLNLNNNLITKFDFGGIMKYRPRKSDLASNLRNFTVAPRVKHLLVILIFIFGVASIIGSSGGGGGGDSSNSDTSSDSIVSNWKLMSYSVDNCTTTCPGQENCTGGSFDSISCR